MSDVETVELSLPLTPLRYPVELVGRVRRGFGLRGLSYEISAPLKVPCQLLVRPDPVSQWRHGIASVREDGCVDLSVVAAIAEGDYIYRIGKPLTPSLEERVAAIEAQLEPERSS